MEQPDSRHMGDGRDDYGNAARQMATAMKKAGEQAAKESAKKGAELTANAAAASVKAGVEGGSAVAGIAEGTAAGGPWGAVLAVLWSMKDSIFRAMVVFCLMLLFLIVFISSIPSIMLESMKNMEKKNLMTAYRELSSAVSGVIDEGYDHAFKEVEKIIEKGGYDYDESMESLINEASVNKGYNVCYILAAYSVSKMQKDTSKEEMINRLRTVISDMFPVTFVEKEKEVEVPAIYYTYNPKTIVVIKKQTEAGTVGGIPQYTYETAIETVYERGEEQRSKEPVTVTAYVPVAVTIPVYENNIIIGTETAGYYKENGTETINPETKTVKIAECTIHAFNDSVVAKAFGINLNDKYGFTSATYNDVINCMAKSLKMLIYGSMKTGDPVELDDKEFEAFADSQDTTETRKYILKTALSLVGKVPYFWGGKSSAGWNEEWNKPKLVTAVGSPTSGTIRPYGLDCSGFTSWVYQTALGEDIGAGTGGQYPNTTAITQSELEVGDLGFLAGTGGWSHVLMFAGYGDNGQRMWVHCSSSSNGVVLNTPSYEGNLSYRRLKNIDYDTDLGVEEKPMGEALYSLDVDVTHYCACTKCCGSDACGITASGKKVKEGMVAMSSQYPFGTQIMIKGKLYTVEDRGGSGIENDIHRVDIYVPDHNEALRLGRFKTKAKIYRLGR